MRHAIFFAGLLAAVPSFAAELGDAQARVDEVVADTSFLIPLDRAEAPIPFENFRYPYLDEQGNVLFIGNDVLTFGASGRSGIFRSIAASGELKTLVRQEDLSPDDGKAFGLLLGLHTDFDSLVFHRGPDCGIGIYGIFGCSAPIAIANRGTTAPGTGHLFEWFWYPDVQSGNVVFHGTYDDRGSDVGGLYWYRRQDERLFRLIDESQPLAQIGSRLALLAYQPRIDRSWIVFSANRKDATGQALAGRGILGWPLTMDASGKIDERSLSLDRLQVLAPFGMPIPDSENLPLTSAPNPIASDGVIAVRGGSGKDANRFAESAPYQCILVRTQDGQWHNPVDTNTIIPNVPGNAVFTEFSKWVEVDEGCVVFRAFGPDSYQAIYLYDVAKDVLYFITDNTRAVEGRRISSFEISDDPLSGSRMAMMIRFEDKTSGVYLASLPGLPVRAARLPR